MTALPVVWGDALKREYQNLFDSCKVHQSRLPIIDAKAREIAAHKAQYKAIADKIPGLPWWVIGVIHLLECGLDFKKHLHNGDPLTDRTHRVPAGRPLSKPPFTFEESALDALALTGWHKEKDFSIARILYKLEGYNGYGYRQYHPQVKSPYLWSFTHHYTKGKYTADGHYDPECVSQQAGIAAVIKRGFDLKLFQ